MFKKKRDTNKIKEEQKQKILIDFISELRKNGYTNEQIKEKFKEKNYPKDFIDLLNRKEVKMKTEEYDEEEDFEEEDEEDEEEEVEKPKIQTKKLHKKKLTSEKPKEKEVTMEELVQAVQTMGPIINQLDQRLQTVEASLYRIKNL